MNRAWIVLGVAVAVGVGVAFAADGKTGPKVGEKAPDFKLKDQAGKDHALAEMVKDGPVAVVFFRSAAWCPYCQKQLVALQKDIKTIEAAGLKIVAVSYDSPEVLKAFAEKQKITFPLLSDPESKTIVAYSLKNTEMAGKKYGTIDLDGIPYPGTVIVNKDGTVKAKLFQDGYKERHSTEALLKAAK